MTAAFPGQYNTFIPNMAASGGLEVDFSRNVKDFALPKYCQYVTTQKNIGRYLEMTVEQAGRLLNVDGADVEWPDGTISPKGVGNTESFEFKGFTTKRRNFPFLLGELAVEQAEFDVLAKHARYAAQRAMTYRTLNVITALETSGNWDSAHTSAVSSISGVTGKHDVSTTARMDIKRSLDHAADQIRKSTLGAVKNEDLIFLISPGYARKISVCQEIVDYIKQSTVAKEYIQGKLGPNAQYGLPPVLYGYNVVVEDAVRVSTRKGAASTTKSYVKADASPVLLSRPGGLEGVEGAPSFSTVTLFFKEEMTVESKHDRDERMHLGRVVEDYATVVTAPISGYLFTAAVD